MIRVCLRVSQFLPVRRAQTWLFWLVSTSRSNGAMAASVMGSVANWVANAGRTITGWAPAAIRRESTSADLLLIPPEHHKVLAIL